MDTSILLLISFTGLTKLIELFFDIAIKDIDTKLIENNKPSKLWIIIYASFASLIIVLSEIVFGCIIGLISIFIELDFENLLNLKILLLCMVRFLLFIFFAWPVYPFMWRRLALTLVFIAIVNTSFLFLVDTLPNIFHEAFKEIYGEKLNLINGFLSFIIFNTIIVYIPAGWIAIFINNKFGWIEYKPHSD